MGVRGSEDLVRKENLVGFIVRKNGEVENLNVKGVFFEEFFLIRVYVFLNKFYDCICNFVFFFWCCLYVCFFL